MYVILTSKPGLFRTEIVDGLRPLQAYDYLFYGIRKATFVIAELVKETKIRVVDETFRELQHLTTLGTMDTSLRKL